MFEINCMLRIFSLLGSLLMCGTTISGLIVNNCTSDIILCIHFLIMGLVLLYYEFFNNNKIKQNFDNEYLFRLIFLSWNGFLMLGINNVSIGFGIYNIIIGISNGLYLVCSSDKEYIGLSDQTENI